MLYIIEQPKLNVPKYKQRILSPESQLIRQLAISLNNKRLDCYYYTTANSQSIFNQSKKNRSFFWFVQAQLTIFDHGNLQQKPHTRATTAAVPNFAAHIAYNMARQKRVQRSLLSHSTLW